MNGSNYSTVNAANVGFSQGARVLVGPVGAGKGGCRPIGLLGADATLTPEKTYRTKTDHFPEVEVASAIQTLSLTGNFVVREWNKENLMLALDVAASDVTDVAGTPQNVTDEAHTLDANGIATLRNQGASSIVVKKGGSTASLGTDYVIATVLGYQRVVALSGGTLAPSDEINIDYSHTPIAHSIMPLGHAGARQYYEVWVEEGRTTSVTARTDYQLFRAAIGIDGAFNINSPENGADLPLVIQVSLLPGQTSLGRVFNYQ